MAEPPGSTDNHVATLAAALSSRVGVLSDVARDTLIAIERDREVLEDRYGSTVMADELIDAVRGRLAGVASDCADVTAILNRFQDLAAPAPVSEPPAAFPTPPPAAPTAPVQVPQPPVSDDDAQVADEAPPSERARLLAAQMSIAGASRDEIAVRLRKEFGVREADRLDRELF